MEAVAQAEQGKGYQPAAGAPAWIRGLAAFSDKLDRVTQICFVTLTALFAAVMLIGVFFRYALNNSLAWSDELALIVFTWAVFLSIASGYLHDRHVNLDIIMRRLPPCWNARMSIVADGLGGGYLFALTVSGIQALDLAGRGHTDALRQRIQGGRHFHAPVARAVDRSSQGGVTGKCKAHLR